MKKDKAFAIIILILMVANIAFAVADANASAVLGWIAALFYNISHTFNRIAISKKADETN